MASTFAGILNGRGMDLCRCYVVGGEMTWDIIICVWYYVLFTIGVMSFVAIAFYIFEEVRRRMK